MACTPSGFRRYYEPFAGSGCLFFALHPKNAVLGDTNEELLGTYAVIRDHPRLIARRVHAMKNTKRAYYAIRAQVPGNLHPIARAARFVYLNRYCFNGVYRTNRMGEFNVPRGVRTGRVPDECMFYRCAFALRRAELRPVDFEACTADAARGDFVYLDPPYATIERRRFGEYGYGCFEDSDLGRLLRCLKRLERAGATFLLSYSDSPSIVAELRQWTTKRLRVRRHVAGFAKHRALVTEVLVSNRRELITG